ncbi:uncharacterized protein [Primulina huaijiensis]|uniref:uncharacterized protein n=1 Tax=Primulina huaijiensis TaxID=1492673 RepID=UPI003CC6E93E
MKLACWNIRGFHKPLKQKSVQYIMNTRKIEKFGILESKLDEKALQNLMRVRFQGMRVFHNFMLNDKGQIMVLWYPSSVNIDLIDMSDQAVHVRVICLRTKFTFLASFVYGFNTIRQRRMLWDELIAFSANCQVPWMLLGGFNNVLSPDEKKGGLKVNNYEIKDFVECINSIDLMDLRSIGCFYTWMSPRVCSKLDRVLVDNRWITSNVEGVAEFIAPGCVSDHSLTIVSLLEPTVNKKRPFKFFNMCALSEHFEVLVLSVWKFQGHDTAQFRLKQLFKGLKKPLEALNCKHFSHISARATKAKQELEELQGQMLLDGVMRDRYKSIRRNAEMLLEAERSFIAQKAKIKFLQPGDRCTKFYHDLIKRNNKRNAIAAIQNTDGTITTDQAEIVQLFIDSYKNLLGRKVDTIPVDREIIMAGACVPTDDWAELTRLVTRA